jgi:hypothetical protein
LPAELSNLHETSEPRPPTALWIRTGWRRRSRISTMSIRGPVRRCVAPWASLWWALKIRVVQALKDADDEYSQAAVKIYRSMVSSKGSVHNYVSTAYIHTSMKTIHHMAECLPSPSLTLLFARAT